MIRYKVQFFFAELILTNHIMYRKLLFIAFIALIFPSFGQDSLVVPTNSSQVIIDNYDRKLTIGGYAQIDYNQPIGRLSKSNGELDVHRLVLLFGYKFNPKLTFVSEIEYEHVSEVYVEQAFINYKINEFINFQSGLLLIPMGYINSYHEPTSFNGVERPNLDGKIIPTTWREIGAGFSGSFKEIGLKYQIYTVNGFKSFDGKANLNGVNALRSGRQKGVESFISFPNFAARADYYGLLGLNLGISAYTGKTESTLYDGKTNIEIADSSVVGMNMIGFDFRFSRKGFILNGQYVLGSFSNTIRYNSFGNTDLASEINGYYIECGYNILRPFDAKTELIVFTRYENYNTHAKVDATITKNDAYNRTEITSGLGWKLDKGVVLKSDIQFFTNKSTTNWDKQLNFGIGLMF